MASSGFRTGIGGFPYLLVVLLAFGAGPATALSYFNGPGGFGFNNSILDESLTATFSIASAADWLPAGSAEFDDGSFDIGLKAKQKVVRRNGRFRVKVKWVIENRTVVTMDQVLLFFSALGQPPDFPDYSGHAFDLMPVSLKHAFDVIRYESAGTTYHFVGWALDNLAPGPAGRVKRKFRYDVIGPVVAGRGPALGVAAAIPTAVPEPSSAWLLAASLAGFAALQRR